MHVQQLRAFFSEVSYKVVETSVTIYLIVQLLPVLAVENCNTTSDRQLPGALLPRGHYSLPLSLYNDNFISYIVIYVCCDWFVMVESQPTHVNCGWDTSNRGNK